MDTYGISFSPTQSMDKSQQPTDPNANVQEAIRTLALRLPKVTGAKGFAPDALMGGMGAQGQQNGALGLDRLLAAIFGAGGQGGMSNMGGGPVAAPRVTGIDDPGRPIDLVQSPAPEAPQEQAAQEQAPQAMPPRTYNKPIMPGKYSTDY